MSQVPVLGQPSEATERVVAAPPRLCGRCRVVLEDDPDLDPVAQSSWALCARCRSILLPNHRTRVETAERRRLTARHGE